MALSRKKQELLDLENAGYLRAFSRAQENNGWEELRKKLKAAGEDFAKEDFLTLKHDKYFNLICYSSDPEGMPIKGIDYIMGVLNELGTPFTIKDWKTSAYIDGDTRGMLIDAPGHHKVLAKVFKPEFWANRTDEMKELWDNVNERYRRQVDFPAVLAQAEALSGPEFEIRKSLRKDDLFEKNDKGRVPLDDSRTWKKLDQIIGILQGKDDQLTKADLLRKSESGRTYLEIGVSAGQQDKIFELLERNGEKLTPQDVKAANIGHLFANNNREFWDAARDNDITKVKRSLKAGMVDLEYIPDGDSDKGTAYWQAAWKGKTEMQDILFNAGADPATIRASGKWSALAAAVVEGSTEAVKKGVAHIEERYKNNPAKILAALTVENRDGRSIPYLARDKGGEKDRIIKDAVERAKEKVKEGLAPAAWKGKLDEMRAFWDELPADSRKGINFEDAFGEAFLLTYPITSATCKEEIFNPKKGQKSPLEFKKGWEQLEELAAGLSERGDPITKKDLLRHASDGATYMQKAIDAGAAEQVFAIMAAVGERMSKVELIDRNGSGKSIVESLGEKGQLAQAFTPSNWVNDVRGMQEVWSRVPRKHQEQLDGKEGRPSFKKLLQQANASSVKALQVESRAVGGE